MDTLNKEGLELTDVPAEKSAKRSKDRLARLNEGIVHKDPDGMRIEPPVPARGRAGAIVPGDCDPSTA